MNRITPALHRTLLIPVVVALAAIVLNAAAASAQPSLGSAGNYGALGATTVTNTGLTVVTGDVGVSPGTAITGFPPGVVTGTIHAGDMAAARAHADAFVANQELKGMACDTNLTGQNLGGKVLAPGVYCFNSSAQLTGVLTLTGAGPWVFKIGSTLTTASAAMVAVRDAGTTCRGANVFWQVGSSATLGTGTMFAGNILAETSITATTRVSVSGSLLAINAAVTMDTNQVTACGATVVPPPNPGDDCPKCKCHCKCRHHDGHDNDHHDCDHDGHGGGHHDGDDDGHHGGRDHDNDHHGNDRDRDRDNDHRGYDGKDKHDGGRDNKDRK